MATLIVAINVQAVDPIYTSVFSNKALKGYDTVAYFIESRPVKGKEDYATSHMGAQWLFFHKKILICFYLSLKNMRRSRVAIVHMLSRKIIRPRFNPISLLFIKASCI
jgi:hypothetical protein